MIKLVIIGFSSCICVEWHSVQFLSLCSGQWHLSCFRPFVFDHTVRPLWLFNHHCTFAFFNSRKIKRPNFTHVVRSVEQSVGGDLLAGYHGEVKWGVAGAAVCSCVCSHGRGSHNEYYHISSRLHLSLITPQPSSAWTDIKGSCGILHSCQSITTSGASPTWRKNSASFLPLPLCYDFTKKTHSEGFSGSARITEGTPNHLFSTQNTVCYQPLHRTHAPPIGKGRGTAPDNTMECINGCAAPCLAHNIIYSSVRGEITAAILFWRKKSSWPGNT